ncbi:hypothetical protein L207DRAFT_156964 [Hyaloscypha variabilis F]|uniref:Uncharacterized protein n=1 Tax=Hyaloscypha variabilis (strain UAMH 11265 / GT02V1 / F) TaxID=1149755 RepID=A0A2J6S9F4_HYAVF|nr:hypothetical protein L207DRAFT_156964 [Hyaloscypha variabilis F]
MGWTPISWSWAVDRRTFKETTITYSISHTSQLRFCSSPSSVAKPRLKRTAAGSFLISRFRPSFGTVVEDCIRQQSESPRLLYFVALLSYQTAWICKPPRRGELSHEAVKLGVGIETQTDKPPLPQVVEDVAARRSHSKVPALF